THFLYRYTAQSYMCFVYLFTFVLFFNATPSTEIYTLSLHDALPISFLPGSSSKFQSYWPVDHSLTCSGLTGRAERLAFTKRRDRSEEHTSELQSLAYLVCRLLLEKKKKNHQLTRHGYSASLPNPVVY